MAEEDHRSCLFVSWEIEILNCVLHESRGDGWQPWSPEIWFNVQGLACGHGAPVTLLQHLSNSPLPNSHEPRGPYVLNCTLCFVLRPLEGV